MSNPIDPKLKEVLQSLAAKKPGQVQDLLAKACANDESLMDELQAIMSDSDIQTLNQATEQNIADWQDLEATITPGEMIGPYKVEHQLGEGGMGVVVKAEQLEPIQRTVAVKIIKQGMSSRQVLRRFQMEQQTLGNMNHPYIAQVYDAGVTPNKRPYFVMEYIQGTPLTHFCDEHKLDLHERLSLFDKVCDGIRYAHQRGIVHRDLKPANILVFESEDKFIPKIIDFGIAKALHTSPEAGQTMLTAWGTTMGSPGYMSPEQARTNEVEIDTRTDVYALGVILYELATGFLPISPDQWYIKSLDEMLNIIINKPAPKPSELLKDSKEQLAEILPNRATTYPKLHRAIKGDLDWIILKAVEKDKNRRYSTAAELQNDIDNYLKGMPVIAGPPGVGYQFKKLVQRNKLPVAAFSLFMLALIGGIVGTTQGFIQAKEEAKIANENLMLLRGFLLSPDPYRKGPEVKAIDLLDDYYQILKKDQTTNRESVVRMIQIIGSTYITLSLIDKAEEVLTENQKRIAEYGMVGTEAYWLNEGSIAYLKVKKGDYKEPIDTYNKITQYFRKKNDSQRALIYQDRTAHALTMVRNFEEAKVLYDDIFSKVHKESDPGFYYQALGNYLELIFRTDQPQKALEISKEILDYYTKNYGITDTRSIEMLIEVSAAYGLLGNVDKMYEIDTLLLEHAPKVYGPNHEKTIDIISKAAITNYLVGNYDISSEMFKRAWEGSKAVFGENNINTLIHQKRYAKYFYNQKDYTTALSYLDNILHVGLEKYDINRITFVDTLTLKAECHLYFDDFINARSTIQTALPAAINTFAPNSIYTLKIKAIDLQIKQHFNESNLINQYLDFYLEIPQNIRSNYKKYHELISRPFWGIDQAKASQYKLHLNDSINSRKLNHTSHQQEIQAIIDQELSS